MNKIALSALLVKTLAAFALPVDIQSYLAYATFPWRPREAFANKKVLITGASQGLGEAIAYYVSSFGANVVLASRNVKNLEGVGKKCLENGAKAVEVVAFDALKPESAEMLAKAASEAFNDGDDEKEDGDSNNNKSYCCDYAFLCAGASQSASAFDVTESAERELFNLNALSTIQVLKNILPSMIARNRGHVCVISSMAAICPAPGQSSYAASKAALSKYVDSLRAEIGHTAKNVTLTNCYPGPIATGFNGKKRVVFNATGVNENHPKGLAKGRLPVETVAKMAVKLTSFGQYSIHLAPKLVIFLSRCVHFCPTVAYAVMDKLGPKRAQAAKKGESLYELKVKDA
jgi:dehydrogenase/reductase SDR family protein 7